MVLFLGFTIFFASTYITLSTNTADVAAENIASIAKDLHEKEEDSKQEMVELNQEQEEDKKEGQFEGQRKACFILFLCS